MTLLGFNGLNCFVWDAERDIELLKVNTKGGNRPVRARYGQVDGLENQCILVYAYGDCLAMTYKA